MAPAAEPMADERCASGLAERSAVLEAAEAIREVGTIFERAESNLRIRGVIGDAIYHVLEPLELFMSCCGLCGGLLWP